MKKKETWWTCGELNCKEPKINVKQINKPKMVNLLNNLNWGIKKIKVKHWTWEYLTKDSTIGPRLQRSLSLVHWRTWNEVPCLSLSFFFFCGWEIRIEPKFRQLNVNHKTLDIWVVVIVVHLKFDDTVGVVL